MDLDYHYSAMYVLSRWAKFGSANSQIIATSCQLVDDNFDENPLSDAGEDEDNARGDPAGRILKIKEHHNDRNTDSAGNTEFIGQSQSISPRRSYSSASVIRTGMKRPGSGRASGQET